MLNRQTRTGRYYSARPFCLASPIKHTQPIADRDTTGRYEAAGLMRASLEAVVAYPGRRPEGQPVAPVQPAFFQAHGRGVGRPVIVGEHE